MNKYQRRRDERAAGGIRLSMCITAKSGAEADAIFEERWQQKMAEQADMAAAHRAALPVLPVITNDDLKAQFLAPEALAVKRRTPLFA